MNKLSNKTFIFINNFKDTKFITKFVQFGFSVKEKLIFIGIIEISNIAKMRVKNVYKI